MVKDRLAGMLDIGYEKCMGLKRWVQRLMGFVFIAQEFCELYKPKVMIFFQEIISVFSTPFILFFTLHDCSSDIIEFIKTRTVNIPVYIYIP